MIQVLSCVVKYDAAECYFTFYDLITMLVLLGVIADYCFVGVEII